MNLTVLLFVAAAFPMLQSADTSASRAGFLVGCWEHVMPAQTIREVWREEAPEFLIGTGTTVAKGVLKEFEFTRIESKAGELIFVNRQHDFPKRVAYKRVSADAVTAWIDGGEGTRKIEFPYTRCK